MGAYQSHRTYKHLDLIGEQSLKLGQFFRLYKTIPNADKRRKPKLKKDMGNQMTAPEHMGKQKAYSHIPRLYYKLLNKINKKETIWITSFNKTKLTETSYNRANVSC